MIIKKTFNDDPDRNQIKMYGSIKEFIERDGTVVAKINIRYKNLPLTVYTLDSFDDAIFVQLDPSQLVKVVEEGTMVTQFLVEMEIPFSGAPLYYWDAVAAGSIRRQQSDFDQSDGRKHRQYYCQRRPAKFPHVARCFFHGTLRLYVGGRSTILGVGDCRSENGRETRLS